MANSKSGESVLHRVVNIISAFSAERSSSTVAVIARRTGLPIATTYRLVNDLVAEGLLERSESGKVRLGVRLWELGSRGSSVVNLREVALPFMEDVHAVIRQHTALSILDGDELLYVEQLSTGASARSIARTAKRLPLHVASSGQVLLAHAPSSFQDRVLGQPLDRFTNRTITDPAELRRRLAEVRQLGFAHAQGHSVPESSGMAVPVYGANSSVVAALCVIVPIEDEEVLTTVAVLRAASLGISRAMGWRSTRPVDRLSLVEDLR